MRRQREYRGKTNVERKEKQRKRKGLVLKSLQRGNYRELESEMHIPYHFAWMPYMPKQTEKYHNYN